MTKYGPLLLICTVYLLGHGLILLSGSTLYWDGHALVQLQKSGGLVDVFWDGGFPLFGYLHKAFISIGPYASRVASLFFHLLAGIALLKILGFCRALSVRERVFVVCLFLVLPFNFARISIVNSQYAFSLLCFMTAWLAWCHYEKKAGAGLRVLAILLFILSFTTQSLLVFFLWPFLHAWRINSGSAIHFALSRLDFLLLPPLFFVLNRALFPRVDTFSTYNNITLNDSLLTGPLATVWSAFVFLDMNLLIAVGMIVFCVALFRLPFTDGTRNTVEHQSPGATWITIGLGITIALSALLPYLLVNKLPLYQGWSSRHQLLLPLGTAVTVLGIVRLCDRKFHTLIFGVATGLCLATSVSGYWQYLVDGIKQDAFVYSIADNTAIQNGSFFPVVDNLWYLNAFRRQYNLTEYDSLMKRAFDDERNRLALDRNYGRETLRNDEEMAALFKDARNYYMVSNQPITAASMDCTLVISPGTRPMSVMTQIVLTYKKLFSLPDYTREVSALQDVKCIK